jgi:hypothetical protein
MVHVLHQGHASVLTLVNGLVVIVVLLCASNCVSMEGSAPFQVSVMYYALHTLIHFLVYVVSCRDLRYREG